ncbi:MULTISPECIES: integrase arm-type DNA-binding domain-containing protein [Rhodomicrobium]|uniref:tyrosine-type recombinase/integrase n=1 Tax=Rhodomicrobium TaxID=1068 RepID=UPI000B4A7D10|nr:MULTISPECIES: integrase arm-type DNA-binding domain-containing protein [Rhodomicrobium]
MALTDTFLRAAKGREKPWKLADGGGLFILVQPDGKRYWRLSYRFAGKQKTMALGVYPLVTLSAARKARDAAKLQLAENIDPGEVRKLEKMALTHAADRSIEAVGRMWHENKKASLAPRYAGQIMDRLEADVFPVIGKRLIADITVPELLQMLRKIEARGSLVMAKRVREHVSQIFRFAVSEGIIPKAENPCDHLLGSLKPSPKVKPRGRVHLNELPELLRAIDGYDGEATTRLALKLVILTLTRTTEVRGALWAEFEGLDTAEPLWRIPKERMKMAREHLIPLPKQAVAILDELRPLTGCSPLLFTSPAREGIMSNNTMLFALYRMGYHSRMTTHGFRGIGSTILNERGFDSDAIERQLAHDDDDKIRGAYNSAEYLPERRAMLQWYADHLDVVKAATPGDKVVSLPVIKKLSKAFRG